MFYQLDSRHSLKPASAFQLLRSFLNFVPESNSVKLLNIPESGDAFLYYCKSPTDDLFKIDGYRWVNGSKYINPNGETVQYYYIALPPSPLNSSKKASQSSGFKKTVFSFGDWEESQRNPVIIWYSGDADIAMRFPHGNSKTGKTFLPTLPSALEKFKDQMKNYQSVERAYIEMKNSHGIEDGKYF